VPIEQGKSFNDWNGDREFKTRGLNTSEACRLLARHCACQYDIDRLGCIRDSRASAQGFCCFYYEERYHSGLAFFTPGRGAIPAKPPHLAAASIHGSISLINFTRSGKMTHYHLFI
jgi:hypothetical protein